MPSQSVWTVVMRRGSLLDPDGSTEPFKVAVRAEDASQARGKAGRLLKRTYGDGTREGNPMFWEYETVEQSWLIRRGEGFA
jgi:hypothetical protein